MPIRFALIALVPLALMSVSCASKAIDEGTCGDDDNVLFDNCLAAGCSPTKSNSAQGLDSCEGEGSALTQSGSGECAFEGSGSCYVICDCNEEVEEGVIDSDGDGFDEESDCDDDEPSVHPGAADEFGDGVDQNCDGIDGVDEDGDGHPSVESGGSDCDDGDADVYPGQAASFAREAAGGGFDFDCDGVETTSVSAQIGACTCDYTNEVYEASPPGWAVADPGCGGEGRYIVDDDDCGLSYVDEDNGETVYCYQRIVEGDLTFGFIADRDSVVVQTCR